MCFIRKQQISESASLHYYEMVTAILDQQSTIWLGDWGCHIVMGAKFEQLWSVLKVEETPKSVLKVVVNICYISKPPPHH